MCRHLAYLGAPVSLHELVYQPPHSLHTQAYAPREQRHGTVNADGFGVGWFPDPDAQPVRYRRAMPIWADTSFADVAGVTAATCAVAAVRDATPGFAVDEGNAQPFRADGILFSHNGAAVDGDLLAEHLGVPAPPGAPDARAPVDSAALFAHTVRLRRSGLGLAAALAQVVSDACARTPGRYNLLAADGTRIAATTCGDTLYIRESEESVTVASEPFDDAAGWRRVPDFSLVTATKAGADVRPLR